MIYNNGAMNIWKKEKIKNEAQGHTYISKNNSRITILIVSGETYNNKLQSLKFSFANDV